MFAYEKTNIATRYLFGLNIGTSINLSNLPLVGRELTSSQSLGVDRLQIAVASTVFDTPAMQNFNGGVQAAQIEQLPVAVGKRLQFCRYPQLWRRATSADAPGHRERRSPNSPNTPAPPNTSTADNAKWFTLQKAFGPVYFERVGVQYRDFGNLVFCSMLL